MKYEEMTFNQLRSEMNRIDNTIRNFPSMSQQEKEKLICERMKINGYFQRRMAKMLAQFEEED